MDYLKVNHVKEFAKKRNRRVGKDFLYLLNQFIDSQLEKACQVHNGGKRTLDTDIFHWTFRSPK